MASHPPPGARAPGGVRLRFYLLTPLLGVVVLAAMGGLVPLVIGRVLAAHFDRMASRLAVPGYWQVVDRQFDRGWFRSRARIVLRPAGVACPAGSCPVVVLDSRIDQGPVAWGDDPGTLRPVLAVVHTRIDWAGLWPHVQWSSPPPALDVTTHLDWRGGAHVRLRLAAMQLGVGPGKPMRVRVDSSPVTGLLRVRRRAGHNALRLDWPRLSLLRHEGGHLAWQGLHARLGRGPGGPWSQLQLAARSLTLDNGHGRATRLHAPSLDIRRLRRPARLAASLQVPHFVLPDGRPASLVLAGAAQALDPAAWLALPQRWRALGGWRGGAVDESALYRQVLPTLLPPGATLSLSRFALGTPAGTIRVQGRVQAPAAPRPAASAVAWVEQLDLSARVSLPDALVRQLLRRTVDDPQDVDARLAALRARGLLDSSDHGRREVVQLALKGGQLSINDRNRPHWRQWLAQWQAAAPGL